MRGGRIFPNIAHILLNTNSTDNTLVQTAFTFSTLTRLHFRLSPPTRTTGQSRNPNVASRPISCGEFRIQNLGFEQHSNIIICLPNGVGGAVKSLLPPVANVVCHRQKRTASVPPTRPLPLLSPSPIIVYTDGCWDGGRGHRWPLIQQPAPHAHHLSPLPKEV